MLLVLVTVSQLAADDTLVLHVTGQAQFPIPMNVIVCGGGFAAPWTALKERALDDGGNRVQGGCITRFTVTVCGLPGAAFPCVSRPLSVIWPPYVPGVNVDVVT